jgi:hypothetical protein
MRKLEGRVTGTRGRNRQLYLSVLGWAFRWLLNRPGRYSKDER